MRWSSLSVLLAFSLSTQHLVPATRAFAFVDTSSSLRTATALSAKPRRLEENTAGVVYVNDKCINCAACSNFAPATFSRSPTDQSHIVHHQPDTALEIKEARQALAACPVAAIRVETLGEKRHRAADKEAVEQAWTDQDQWLVDQMSGKAQDKKDALFPRSFMDSVPDVYWLGHHNDKSFGATPYLLRVPDDDIWIMIDTPKYSKSSIQAVTSLTGPQGPDYLVLTHVDDTADHGKWAEHFAPRLKRVFHAGDLGKHNWLNDRTLEEVEILLKPQTTTTGSSLAAYTLDGTPLNDNWQEQPLPSVVLLHTPGHSPGSITLYRPPSNDNDGILFTGDTYAYTTRKGGYMTGFPRYGNNLHQQATTLQDLLSLDWSVIAPGHGHPRDYRSADDHKLTREQEMEAALEELRR